MTTTQTPDNTVLALYPPRAPEATTPIIGAHYGVPKHVYDLKPMGLTIVVDPLLDGTVNAGDVIRLILNNASIEATKTIQPGEENAEHTLYLPKGLLLPDRDNTLVYSIARGSQNIGRSTPELTLWYNAKRPGNEDLTPGDGAHSELRLILPQDVIDDGIDAERAKQGVQVCFAYPYCRAYDVIRLNCNGQDVVRTVTAAEAPATPSDEPTTICVMVGEDVFQRAGDNTKFVFSYTVLDQLLNGPDTDSPYSGRVEIDVHLKETRLVAPDLAEDPDDWSDDPKTISLAKLGSKDLTVLVHAFAPRWQPNDKIRVTYTATKPGAPVVSHTVEADVGRIPFTYKLMVPNAKVIAGSVARAKYELIRGGDIIATSNTAKATVTDAAPIQLTPVVLLAPATNPIDPLNNSTGVTVQATYLQALPGDKAQLVIAGAQPFLPVTLNPNKQADFRLDAKFLAERLGSDSRIIWQLIRDDKVIAESPEFILTVSAIKPEDPRFPIPTIIAVKDDRTLNLGSFAGGTRMLVAPWRLIAVGQPFWAWCEGTNRNGATVTEEIHNGVPIGSTNNQGGPVSREFLDKLADGSTIRVYVAVNLDGVVDRATRVVFPVRSYTVKALEDVKPTIESAKDSKGGDIAQNGTTTDTTITLTGTASKGQSVKILDGTTDHGDAIADASSGVWTKTITGLSLKAHSFTAKALYGTGQISGARALTVVSRLVVDMTPLLLNGLNISMGFTGNMWPRSGNDPTGTSATRAAIGGLPPYTYESSDSSIASVDGKGTVRSEGNGLATIIAKDSSGQSITYNVTTSNVSTYLTGGPIRCDNFDSWVRSVGGKVIPKSTLDTHIPILNIKYVPSPPQPEWGYYFYVSQVSRDGSGRYWGQPLMITGQTSPTFSAPSTLIEQGTFVSRAFCQKQ
ncbi:hypothetical protein [Pseudomonas sp. Irchel 3E19]|uniref:hypothetical protein n=1 Tax=Pseudomonas sp. Irchel 3E19 TaxID=2008981 RepID=UPI000BA4ACED|nr:hypothetical protein [Pseudomonas sp. Irchel 3E19]